MYTVRLRADEHFATIGECPGVHVTSPKPPRADAVDLALEVALGHARSEGCDDLVRKVTEPIWRRDASRLPAIRTFTDSIASSANVGRCAVFVAAHRGNFPTIEYVASAMRARGVRAYGVYLFTDPPEGVFDESFSCWGSVWALCSIVSALPAMPVYLQAHSRWTFLNQLLRSANPQIRIAQEIYDWMDLFVPPEAEQSFVEAEMFSADEIRLMRRSEHCARTCMDGFLHKSRGAAAERLLRSATRPSVLYAPCPPKAWMLPPLKPDGAKWRLVHAGQLRSANAPRAIYGDLQCLPVIDSLTRQGMEVSLYPSFTRSTSDHEALYGDYIRKAERSSSCILHDHLPLRELLGALHGRYHFGLILYRFDDDLAAGRDHFEAALASKLFTYMAAGLPVLVSPELRSMAEIVREHDIGLVLDRQHVASARQMLERTDYARLQANVGAAQAVFNIERYLPDVEHLLFGDARL